MRSGARTAGRREAFTLVEILVVIVIIGVLAIMGVSKYTEFTTSSRREACAANQLNVDKTVAVWETLNAAVPQDKVRSMQLDTNGVVKVESGLSDLSAAAGKSLVVGSQALLEYSKDVNVFVCPERANNVGGPAQAHRLAEVHFEWECGPSTKPELNGKNRGTKCLFYGAPKNGPDGTLDTRHSGPRS